jgi:hypothetical protein
MVALDQHHGVLGQSWKASSRGKKGHAVQAVTDVVEGDVDDYVVGEDVFDVEFPYNKFVVTA